MYWFAPYWILIENRYILISIECECERPWDWSCRHIQSVGNDFRLAAIFFQYFSLLDSESMLLVDDDESEIRELDRILDKRMGTENNIRISRFESLSCIFLHAWSEGTDEEIRADSPLHEPCFIAREMLACENLRRSHDSNLNTRLFDDMNRSNQGNNCFPSSNITLEESRHGVRLFHVLENLKKNNFLLVREWEGKISDEGLYELRVEWCCSRMSFARFEGVIFFLETALLEYEKLSVSEFLFRSFESLYRFWKMDITNIRIFASESFFLADIIWNLIRNLIDISSEQCHFLTNPIPRNIVHIRIYRQNFPTFFPIVFDISTIPRESPVLVFRLSVDDDDVPRMELCQEHATVPPDGFCMESTFVRENRFDEKFFITGTFFGEEFDFALDCLFLLDIDEGEILYHITLILDATRKKREKIPNGLNARFAQFLDVGIRRMEKGFRENQKEFLRE